MALLATALLLAALLAGCQDAPAASTRILIDFPAPREDVDARVPYEEGDNAGTQLERWAQEAGVALGIATFAFGRCLDAIDGVPQPGGCQRDAPGFWALAVNGAAAETGMDGVALAAGDVVAWTYTPNSAGGGETGGDGLRLQVEAPGPTQEDQAMLTGTLSRAARLSVTGLDPIDAPAGAWMVHVPLPHGRTPVVVTADDGAATAQAQVLLVRLASATFEARFTMAVPPRDDVRDTVWYDPDELASAPEYAGKDVAHPAAATVHDLMATWERQAGKDIEYGYFAGLGFSPERIDGVGQPLTASAPPYWCYTLNGASADRGISAQELQPGDVVTWEYGGCA